MSFWNPEYDRLRKAREQWFSRDMADKAKAMPLTESESYWPTRNANEAYQAGWISENQRAGRPAPTAEELQQRFPIPQSPLQSQIQSEIKRNPVPISIPQTIPSGDINFGAVDPQWPVPVPQELIRTGGAGGGMRDSNIQDATGMTGGGGFMTGGAGGGMRDSNIQDSTGTTGGNAGGDVKDKAFDWDGLSGGLAALGKGMKGMSSGQGEMKVPSLMDDSGSRMAAASQLWQAVMNKRKPKGLI